MKTLNISKITRNLALIAAGAFMATLVVVPFTTSADSEDEPIFEVEKTQSTFVIQADNGSKSVFTLVENDGQMVLALVEKTPNFFLEDDDE